MKIAMNSKDTKVGMRGCFALLLICLFFSILEFRAIDDHVVVEGVSVDRVGVISKEPEAWGHGVIFHFASGESYVASFFDDREPSDLKPGAIVRYDLCRVLNREVVANIRSNGDVYFPISELKREMESRRKSAIFLFWVLLGSSVLWGWGFFMGRRQLLGQGGGSLDETSRLPQRR